MTDFGHIRRRQFVAIATTKFEDDQYRELPEVADEVRLITSWLTDERLGVRRFTHVYEELAAGPSYEKIQARFMRPPRDERWNYSDAAVLYITGHGAIDDSREPNRHVLVLNETYEAELGSTALATEQLLGWLDDRSIEYLLVIIDACFAGQVVEELTRWSKGPKDHWLILPSALKDQMAAPGALTKAIRHYLDTAEEFNTHAQYLTVGLFVDALNEQLPPGQKIEKIYKGKRPERGKDRDHDHERHVCLPNPAYQPRDELVLVTPALQALALPKELLSLHNRINGHLPSAKSPGWLFTGREQLMRDLISAAGTPGVTMITGSAGSGKSTALSRLVTLSDRDFRGQYEAELAGVPADLMPLPGSVDSALTARGKTNRQVVTQICHDLGILAHVGSWDDPVRANLEALSEYLAARKASAPVTIVIDALDEAEYAADLVRSVLRPLLREHSERLCLLVGVRSLGGDNTAAEAHREPQEEPLRDLVAAELMARQIAADDDLRWSPRDFTTLVRNILSNTENSPYQNADRTAVDNVADVISSRAGRSYLVARVAAENAAARTEVLASDDPALLDDLKGGLLGVFRRDLQASFSSQHDWRRGVALLRALAFARGAGLPRHQVWTKVATAVDAGSDYGDEAIKWLLESRLSAYLITDQQDDLTVYRLIHDELREILRYQWRELLRPAPRAEGEEVPPRADESGIRAAEARIAEELLSQARVKATVAVNQSVAPYSRRHLAEHALDGGVLDECVPLPFVPYLDLRRLRAAVVASPGRRQLEENIPWLPVIRQIAHLWDWNTPGAQCRCVRHVGRAERAGTAGAGEGAGPCGRAVAGALGCPAAGYGQPARSRGRSGAGSGHG